jgi:hypothetical protein
MDKSYNNNILVIEYLGSQACIAEVVLTWFRAWHIFVHEKWQVVSAGGLEQFSSYHYDIRGVTIFCVIRNIKVFSFIS